ncbi:acetolactate synthase small subunit [Verticiella sediminum]|uniref:acetolactate synthase n=1 Tax=Verticiella sediminum TaxID=1247510 RepID=A0A556AU10_9BURK|nr:acetolactate synthase small subunit [Verticiella sediminum]TSH96396.1 acetolactate synthase small subunit [Verticiella sediminum]
MNAITQDESQALSRAVLEIDVANHPGVMSHVVGLFARRAFNVEGILCLPVDDGRCSRIWLRVHEDARLAQMIRQLEKLEDVAAVRRHHGGHAVFTRLGAFFQPGQDVHTSGHGAGGDGIRTA